jgi:hypothetical protein
MDEIAITMLCAGKGREGKGREGKGKGREREEGLSKNI